MSELGRGDIVLVRFPFTDLRSTKLRPAVVLALHGEDVIVAGIFSSVVSPAKETWLLINEQDPRFSQTGLRKESTIKGEKVAVLHRSIIHSTIGSLHPSLLRELAQCIKSALQID